MQKRWGIYLAVMGIILCGNASAAWEKLPPGYNLMDNEYWDPSRIKNGGSYFIFPLMSNNINTNNSSIYLIKFDCVSGTETELSWDMYSELNLKGKKTSLKPSNYDSPAIHSKLWAHLCKKDAVDTYSRSNPTTYTPQQREAMRDAIRDMQQQQLLNEIDDLNSRRW